MVWFQFLKYSQHERFKNLLIKCLAFRRIWVVDAFQSEVLHKYFLSQKQFESCDVPIC